MNPAEKITVMDLEEAIEDLSMLPFFPSDPGAKSAVMRLLSQMCPHRTSLKWLVSTMLNQVGKWIGPMELRGLLCWKYRPADGVESSCSVSGFTAADSESAVYDEHKQLQAGGWVSKDIAIRKMIAEAADAKKFPPPDDREKPE